VLKNIINNQLVIKCNCGIERTEDIGTTESDVYMTGSCVCGTVEGYNLNLPDEMQEFHDGIEEYMPFEELNQRKYVRDLSNIIKNRPSQ
jgi:hypothetical protein